MTQAQEVINNYGELDVQYEESTYREIQQYYAITYERI